MITFTVFTPTYNRAHLLSRVYNSLRQQTFRDFEWLIVDDGSDDTRTVVETWQREADFPIRYIYQKQQERGYKKKAFNRGVKEAKGELFLPWDSDDEAVPHALETFHRHWMTIPDDLRSKFVGVCGLCVDEKGRIVGDCFPSDVFDSDSLEVRHRYHVDGEKWGFSRTDVLREFPFPEDVSGSVPEGIVWSAISKSFKTRFINEALRTYYMEPDSTSNIAQRRIGQHSEGHTLWARSVIENELSWFFYRPGWFLKMAANYTRFSLHLHQNQPQRDYPVRGRWSVFLVFLMWPLGYLLYRRDVGRARA